MVDDWVAATTRYTSALGLRDADAVTSAATFLRGDAARAWSAREAVLLGQNEAVSLTALRECLIARFTPAATEHTARMQLDKLRQQGEYARIAAYVVEFDRLCALIPSLSGSEQAHRFAAGLQPRMASRVCMNALTGERHTEYAPMRAAALHAVTFAAETVDGMMRVVQDHVTRHTSGRHGGGGANSEGDGHSGGGGKRRLSNGSGRRDSSVGGRRFGHPGASSSGAAGAGENLSQRVLPNGVKVFTGGRLDGQPVRSQDVRKYCEKHDVCLRCFKRGHAAKGCTREPVAGHPDGFKP